MINKKILFILHYPPPVHGAAMVGQYICKSNLINSAFDSRFINLSTSVTVNEIGKGGIKKLFSYARILGLTFLYGLFWRPNLVYITLNSYGLGLVKDSIVVLICRLLSLRHVYHFHNKGVENYSHGKLGKQLYPFIFKKSEVILLSSLLYNDISAYVSKDRVYFCSNGIPDTQYCSKSNIIDYNKPIQLLFLSNLIKSKGVLDLLYACKLLNKDGYSFHCTIAGGEGDISVSELNELIDVYDLSAYVSYLGVVQGQDKVKTFSDADIFIFPTFYPNECFPLVLLEAMQAGLPIISTTEGAIPEIVEDGKSGLIIPSRNPHHLANAIVELLNSPDQLKKMGQYGRNKFKLEYTLEIFENSFFRIIQSIVNKKKI